MHKLNYPKSTLEKTAFEAKYLESLPVDGLNAFLSDLFSLRPQLNQFLNLDFSSILLLPIDQLINLSTSLKAVLNDDEIAELKLICNYDYKDDRFISKLQPSISDFFMNNMVMATCYFCNIDYVNSYDLISDYKNTYDFYYRASYAELMEIEGIGTKSAQLIIHNRHNQPLNVVGLKKHQKQNLIDLKFKKKGSHFTLDHVLQKAEHPIASLSLYNLIPSCFNCNSKLKGSKEIVTNAANHFISPTSSDFNFSENIIFKIFFHNTTDSYLDIKTINDFVLDFEINPDGIDYENYINIFRLRARYKWHKREVIKLVLKRKKYANSRLVEISKVLKMSVAQVKSDVYGVEFFESEYDLDSLIKFKRDIAKGIGLQGVR